MGGLVARLSCSPAEPLCCLEEKKEEEKKEEEEEEEVESSGELGGWLPRPRAGPVSARRHPVA